VAPNQLAHSRAATPLAVVSSEIAQGVAGINPGDRHSREERERLFFEAMMRVLDRENPGYRD
jgi:hypothetical protein